MSPEEIAGAITEVEDIYREVDTLDLSRDCQARTRCCRFRLTGRVPCLTIGEALAAARGVRESGRTQLPKVDGSPGGKEGACPLLDRHGRCSIYARRPLGCRTHFCELAGGNYPRAAVSGQVRRLETLAEQLGQTDVRPIEGAVRDALGLLARCGRRRGC